MTLSPKLASRASTSRLRGRAFVIWVRGATTLRASMACGCSAATMRRVDAWSHTQPRKAPYLIYALRDCALASFSCANILSVALMQRCAVIQTEAVKNEVGKKLVCLLASPKKVQSCGKCGC